MVDRLQKRFSRRQALQLGGAAFLASSFGLGVNEGKGNAEHAFDRSLYRELMQDECGTRYLFTEVGVPNLPSSADGLTVVFLTDIHTDYPGRTRNDAQVLQYTADCVNECTKHLGLDTSDILLGLGGDFVNQDMYHSDGTKDYGTSKESFDASLDAIDRIRAGKRIAQSGNHEAVNQFYRYFRSELVRRGYSHLGDVAFCDEYNGVRIVGLRDYTTDALFLHRAFYRSSGGIELVNSLLTGEDPKIVFSHTPAAFDPSVILYSAQNVHGFSGHLHGLNAPDNAGFMQERIREYTISRMRSFGLEGDVLESRRCLALGNGIPSTLEVTNGFGNHFRYKNSPRMSAYTIVIKQFRPSTNLRTPQYSL